MTFGEDKSYSHCSNVHIRNSSAASTWALAFLLLLLSFFIFIVFFFFFSFLLFYFLCFHSRGNKNNDYLLITEHKLTIILHTFKLCHLIITRILKVKWFSYHFIDNESMPCPSQWENGIRTTPQLAPVHVAFRGEFVFHFSADFRPEGSSCHKGAGFRPFHLRSRFLGLETLTFRLKFPLGMFSARISQG